MDPIHNSELEKVNRVFTPLGDRLFTPSHTILITARGVWGRIAIGEFDFSATTDRQQVHNLPTTILHLLGFDHWKLA